MSVETKKLVLPEAPEHLTGPVKAWSQPVIIPTYPPHPPDVNPMFLEKRVYQGSSGKVYPLPFYNRIGEEKIDQSWDALHIENQYLRVMVLPQLGGRIHVAMDKTNGYDFIYRQNVIKPALVGLSGPWASGGVEFNWPQHHRPGTFMPVDSHIEAHPDGSRTLWLSEHDPMNRLKGMHGVCLHPDKALLELKVRLYNRTETTQTFLWWANVGVHVHERYQSFFPPDVRYVAHHARRAISTFPLCEGKYYGVDYARRAREGLKDYEKPRTFVPPGDYPPNDLSRYANIPVPTSYMAIGSKEDFVGGYDHAKNAGIVMVANHHISPGKKQWTWGNHEFGYAWDRNLTDDDGPYIELMAGVYTDNQPDFSFLAPGETRTFSQYWYPIQSIGPAHQANAEAAVSLTSHNGTARVGVAVSTPIEHARVRLAAKSNVILEQQVDLAPDKPFIWEGPTGQKSPKDLHLAVLADDGRGVIAYAPIDRARGPVPPAATEPPPPEKIPGNDELYLTGLHLDQYRHATRSPELYWSEALRRDPTDTRCNNAMGLRCLRRGQFDQAARYFKTAVDSQTRRNANPCDGESYYNLGVALRWLGRDEDAYAALYKSTWNYTWQSAAFYALAELDCRKQRWQTALDHLDRALRVNQDHLKVRDLRVMVLRKLGRNDEARRALDQTLALDPLDFCAQYLTGRRLPCDTQLRFDLAIDLARAGFTDEAIEIIQNAQPEPISGVAPLIHYYLGWLEGLRGNDSIARDHYARAAAAPPDYCFPSRLEEIQILQSAMRANPGDPEAPYYLGNLFYDRTRYREAITLWEKSTRLDASFPTVWRNLGIAYFNVLHDPSRARKAYEKAFRADPRDARILYERDQLWKRTNESPARRLAELQKHPQLVRQRDDLSVELASLLNQLGRSEDARSLLSSRNFQPWEGGEGLALGQHVRTHLALGQSALKRGDASEARRLFETALASPPNLGEAKHLLANQSDVWYWLGQACDATGDPDSAQCYWTRAAEFTGDFQQMSVRPFSEMSYYSALSLRRLGREKQARAVLNGLKSYAAKLMKTPAKIDYFATSLPTMLLFDDDLQKRQKITALFLSAQAELGLGRRAAGLKLLRPTLRLDPNHLLASELLAEHSATARSSGKSRRRTALTKRK